MANRTFHLFLTSTSGAVAPMVALSMVGIIAGGGIAFDYSRLVGMHSELQNAADQAALAAASQLDGRTNAIQRATNAASGLVANSTLLSNDGGGSGISIANATFYQDKDRTQPTTSDSLANYVQVTVNGRKAFYALTPVVGLMSSNTIDAKATAGLGSATCKVPPLMLCNPAEFADPDFTVTNFIGKGLRLVANDGGGSYGPGNFGFLDNNAGNGANTVRMALGNVAIPGDCIPDSGVTTQPGSMVSVLDAFNTRFDIYANGLNNPCGSNNAGCPPSANTRKDVIMQASNGNGNGSCAFSNGNGNGWKEAPNPYLPSSSTPYNATTYPASGLSPMGYPRDICHALSMTGSCSGGRIGDGDWDRFAYFRSNSTNYPSVPTSAQMVSMFGTATPTRYQVYQYEMANAASRLQPQSLGSNRTSYGAPVCVTPGLSPGGSTPDRRRLTVAVLNCNAAGVHGTTTNVPVIRWLDVFLTEPSLSRTRTSQSDVYVEVIAESNSNGDGTAGQVVRREVPYLVQ